jgi:hypothetical protein
LDRNRLGAVVAVGAIAAALAAFFWPLFAGGVSALTGDNLSHSLPLNFDLARALDVGPWRFWNDRAAFGFPLFAEGQSGFAHPWKLLLLSLFPVLAAHDLLYVSSFLIAGAGACFIARRLGLAALPAALAGFATAFSPIVLDTLYNAAYAHSIAWAAVCLLAFERWWAAPGSRSLAFFAASVALLLCAGYPPTAYAFFLFLGVAFATRLALDRTHVGARIGGVAAALALGAGLAALQMLPLVELLALSVRQDAMTVLNAFPWLDFAGGLVFDPDPALYQPGRYAFFVAPLATTLALVAVPFLPALREPRALSYVAGVVVCAGAASGPGSALFDLLRATLPGFDRLRLLSPFLFVAVVPSAVLLAALLTEATRPLRSNAAAVAVGALALVFALFAVAAAPSATLLPWVRHLLLGLAAAAAAGLAIARIGRRNEIAWLVWIAVLLVEIAVLRAGHRAWLPDTVLREGDALVAELAPRVHAHPDSRAIHFPSQRHRATFDGMVRQHWKSPGYAELVRTSVRVQIPFANLLGDLPFAGMNGALAFAGYDALVATMHEELRGRVVTPPGERALDRWSVRWMLLQGDLAKLPRAAGFERVWSDPRGDVELLENRSARDRFEWQPGANDAPALEAPAAWRRAIEALPWVTATVEPAYAWSADSPGALFAAVPLHPSWSAVLDGRAVAPLRARDGLGMEIPAGTGPHRVELRFVPHAFHLGVVASAASALVVLALALRGRAS